MDIEHLKFWHANQNQNQVLAQFDCSGNLRGRFQTFGRSFENENLLRTFFQLVELISLFSPALWSGL